MTHAPITELELRQEYHRGAYTVEGITFDHCMRVAPMRAALVCAIKSRRQREAAQARGVAIERQVKEAA